MLGNKTRDKSKIITYWIGKNIAKTGINPNLFTILAIPIGLVGGLFIYTEDYIPALLFIVLSTIWDALDGSVARAQNKASKFGNYLDAMVDKAVEISIYLGFAFAGFGQEAFLVIAGSMLISYAKPRTAMVIQIDNHDWPAVGERFERVLFLILTLLIALFVQTVNIGGKDYEIISILLYSLSVIVFFGSIQRILYAKNLIEKVK